PAGAELQRTEEYIIANVDTDIISLDSLRTLSAVDLVLARNEIFARHGRRFNTTWIQDYFDKQSWYQGTIAPEDFDPDVLNDVEHTNVDRMQYVEKNH
ncbi:MAG: YARHG domain-containing protein, partial [Oscillospiraceae bacterium]|nr:YARHG domain-containing protein [Oscillospiraceae bacterium]